MAKEISADRLTKSCAAAAGLAIKRLHNKFFIIKNDCVAEEFCPLECDATAFRLALMLEFKVMVMHDASQPKPWLRIESPDGFWTHVGVDEFSKHRAKRTRHAIAVATHEFYLRNQERFESNRPPRLKL